MLEPICLTAPLVLVGDEYIASHIDKLLMESTVQIGPVDLGVTLLGFGDLAHLVVQLP
jgi:hypothetical protein